MQKGCGMQWWRSCLLLPRGAPVVPAQGPGVGARLGRVQAAVPADQPHGLQGRDGRRGLLPGVHDLYHIPAGLALPVRSRLAGALSGL